MLIQSYQIHNVLNVYRKQLSQGRTDQPRQMGSQESQKGAVTISKQGRNQSIIDKVTANVLEKITNIDPGSDFRSEMIKKTQEREKEIDRSQKDTMFEFNAIVENNRKETRCISIDDSQGLMNRLNELAQAAISSKAE